METRESVEEAACHWKFGPFARVFDRGELRVPGHLVLMNTTKPEETAVVVRRIEGVLQAGGYEGGLRALLSDVNWRPHLVGAVAMVLMDDPLPFVAGLWQAVRHGSWMSPQLLLVLSAVDPDFWSACDDRAACWFDIQRPPGAMSAAAAHSARGPGNVSSRAGKELSALVAIAEEASAGAAWLARVQGDPRCEATLAADIDKAGQIVRFWGAGMRTSLDVAGYSGRL